jgi:uncharacterized protein (UPF0276 family)
MYATRIPALGVGLGWRMEIQGQILDNLSHVDWLEVITEHFIGQTEDRFAFIRQLSEQLPVVPHGIDLSIGTDVPVEEDYLEALARIVKDLNAPWFTDHLCFTRVPGVNVGQLTPLQFSRATVETVVRKVSRIKGLIDRPFLLENITYQFKIPGSEMSETEFLTAVLEEADIGMLLDVANLFINSANHGYDPYDFLKSIPLDRVVQLHIAGGEHFNNRWYDTHSMPVHEEVFDLVEYIVAHAPVRGILLERDQNYPASFQEIADELGRAREIFNKYHAVTPFEARRAVPAAPAQGQTFEPALAQRPGHADCHREVVRRFPIPARLF